MNKTDDLPLVSVIMGVYNCVDTLPAAISSVMMQTYEKLELIICDDGSTDGTARVAELAAEKDPRIKILRNEKNLTLAPSLNRCLDEVLGEFVARMDGDDLISPVRLAAQVKFLESHLEVAFVSCAMLFFDERGIWGRTQPKESPSVRDLLKGVPYSHAGTVFRSEAIRSVGGYSEEIRHRRVEDYRLWLTLQMNGFSGQNMSDVLYYMRNDRAASQRRSIRARWNEAGMIAAVVGTLGLSPWNYFRCIRPLVLAFLPVSFYDWLHRAKRGRVDVGDIENCESIRLE